MIRTESPPPLQDKHPAQHTRVQPEALKHFHATTWEQQLALIEEARAARRAAQQPTTAANIRLKSQERPRD